MVGKPSVYLGAEIYKIINDRKPGGSTTSGVIKRIGTRYDEIIRRNTDALPLNEWEFLMSALQGVALGEKHTPHALTGVLEDFYADMGLVSDLYLHYVDRMEERSWLQKIAIIDVAERFYATDHLEPVEDRLIQAGARIKT